MHELPEPHLGLDIRDVNIYERGLPHWRREGVVYFVTFRLNDSIPKEVLNRWLSERNTWLERRGIRPHYTPHERAKAYAAIAQRERRAFERKQRRKWFNTLDECHGTCCLRKPEAAAIVASALRYHDGVRLRCGDFVVMPNHVHWLVLPLQGVALESILQSVKGWSARQINRLMERKGALWQKESFDHIVRGSNQLERIREYIAQNPEKSGLRPDEFQYFRAEWL